MGRKRKLPGPATMDPPPEAPPLRLEWRSPAELAVNPRNWRTHPEAQQAALAGVLSEVGWAGACLYNETTGLLIDGHLRQKVALANGSERIPVLVGNWTPEQEAKILATLDPIAGLAGADPVKLDALLQEVNTGCAELQQMLDDLWSDVQADALADATPADPVDAEPQTDRAAELQAKWGTAAGQLWLLGKHRLLCGDSTKPEDVARVMDGKKADLLCTDPPYGQAFLSNHYGPNRSSPNPMGRLQNDDKPRPEMLSIWFELIADHGAAYVCTRWAQLEAWRAWIAERETVRNVIVWKKNNWSAGNLKGAFGFMYELLIFASKDGHELRGDRLPDVWEFDRVAPDEHPTTKPTGLMERAIEKSSDAGDVVADPFLGSGTTLIAAENLGRRCFGLEISPAYCAVILQRYADAFPDQEIRQAP